MVISYSFSNIQLFTDFVNVFFFAYNLYYFFLVIKTTVIHPATEKHIVKFSAQKCYMVDETPEIYKEIVLPHLAGEQLHLQVCLTSSHYQYNPVLYNKNY